MIESGGFPTAFHIKGRSVTRQFFKLSAFLDDEQQEDRFLLRNESEIRTLLHHLQKRRSHVTGHFNDSHDVFSTTILKVENSHLIMEGISDAILSKRILECSQLLFSSFHACVPVRFISSLIADHRYNGALAFTLPIPQEVLWRQRREFFRVPVPPHKPALCEMDLKTGEIARNPLSDISVGGLGLMMPASSNTLNKGLVIGDCQIDLPGFGALKSDLQVCNESHIEFRNGHTMKRYGCQFVNLRNHDQTLLQRYVIKLESELYASRTTV